MSFDFLLTENGITVDLSVLKDLVGDDIDSIRSIIELFLTTMPPSIEKMKQYDDQQDWENLFKTAHTVKSSVSVIKVDELYDAVVAVESKAENRVELDSIRPMIEFIALKYAIAERLLKKELQRYWPNS